MIDLDKLKQAAEGDPTTKVTVNRAWLAEVHRTITALQANQKATSPGGKNVEDAMSRLFGGKM